MKDISLEELLEAGCHFGHQVTRQNPKARDFIFEARDNIHIIDLAKTKEGLDQAAAFVKELARKGGLMVVVGTKRQGRTIVEEEVKRAQAATASNGNTPVLYYVTNRWIGGLFTNFPEVTKNFKRLKDLRERLKNEEEKAKYTKKEVGLWEKTRQKLQSFYGGISDLTRIPDAILVIDTHLEGLAVDEAGKTGVKTVGIVDTNADPFVIDYPIPANDDAVGSIKLILSHLMDAWIEGAGAAVLEAEGKKEETASEKKSTKVKEESSVKEKPVKTAKEKIKDTKKIIAKKKTEKVKEEKKESAAELLAE